MFKKLAATSLLVALSISAVSVSAASADPMMRDHMMMKRQHMMMVERRHRMMMMQKRRMMPRSLCRRGRGAGAPSVSLGQRRDAAPDTHSATP